MSIQSAVVSPIRGLSTRIAITMLFFVFGARMATWYIYVPYLQERFGLSEGALGMVFLAGSIGAILGASFGGMVIAHSSSRSVAVYGQLAFALIVPGKVLLPSLPIFIILSVLYGFCVGVVDIALNTQGIALQKRLGQPVLSSFHGVYSVGSLIGAAVGSLVIAANIAPAVHVWTMLSLLSVMLLVASRSLIPPQEEPRAAHQAPRFTLPQGQLLWIALLIFVAYVAEETIISWSGIYLQNVLNVSESVVPLGYVAFAFTMTIGRLTGDQLALHLTPVQVLRLSGLITAVGLTLGLMIPHPVSAILGFGCAGLGIANMAPVLLSATGRVSTVDSSVAMSAVSTVAYTAFIIGPPVIGFTAQAMSLSVAIGLVALVCGITALFAGIIEQNLP